MMKKVVSLLLALVMALGLCVNVWAEGGPPAPTGNTGTSTNYSDVGNDAANNFIKTYIVFDQVNGGMFPSIKGTTFGQNGGFTAESISVAETALQAYTALTEEAKTALDVLKISDGMHLLYFSEMMRSYEERIKNGPDTPSGGQVNIDKALKDAGYTAPVLRSEGNAGDFYITFPKDLEKGKDYEYNYANGVLTVTVLKGSEEHWLAAAKDAKNGNVGYTLHFVKPENAARIAKFNGNNDQTAYQFINGNMKFNGASNEQAFGGVMAAVNQSGDVLSVTATPNFNGMRSFVVWAAGAESEEAGQNTPIKKLAIRAEIVIEKENYFHYETISQPINDVEASRLTSGAILETKYQSAWECTALEPGVLIVRPTDGKTVNESLNASQNVPLGKVTITAPSGYTLVLDACKVLNGNNAAISENSKLFFTKA